MIITIRNQKLTIDELISGKINENIFNQSEKYVIGLIKKWVLGANTFAFTTSGSTGKAKKITLSRTRLAYSASATLEYLDPDREFKTSLLCIDPKFVGGAMVIVRALVRDLDLTVVEPGADPLKNLEGHFDLVSMVPLQVKKTLEDAGTDRKVGTLLIGGAPLAYQDLTLLKSRSIRAFHTYGMTETASHIALSDICGDDGYFKTIGDVRIDTDDRGCLKIKGTVTGNQWIRTNDVVELHAEDAFTWKGRADFIINSGGVKVNPESVEQALEKVLSQPFIITSIPDEKLGQKVVMVVEGERKADMAPFLGGLHPYSRPKEVFFVPKFIYTESGKINRLETQKLILSEH